MLFRSVLKRDVPVLEDCLPVNSIDASITTCGAVLIRLSFDKCLWTDETHDAAVRLCSWIRDCLQTCC